MDFRSFRLGTKIPTPLEIADAALDSVAEVAQFPARLVGNVAAASQQGARSVEAAIAKPKDVAAVPAPPDVIVSGAADAVSGVANAAISGVTGVFKSVTDTGEGVKRQIDALIK